MRKSIFFMFGLSALLMSCSENKKVESLTVTAETTEIKGALKGCYEVVQKDYKIKNNGWSDVISVEIKRTDKELPFDPQKTTGFGVYDSEKPTEAGFGIELIDENGDVVQIKNANESGLGGAYSSDDIEATLQLNSGEIGIIRWSVDIKQKPISFRITSALNTRGEAPNSHSASTTSDTIVEEASNNNWDSTLDEYEEYIDKYIKFYKKAQNGDMSAMSEYATLLEKAQSLSEKLSDAQGDLTPKQVSRFVKLQQKLANAAM